MKNRILMVAVMKLRHITEEEYEQIVYDAEGRSSVFDLIIDSGIADESKLHAELAERLRLNILPDRLPAADYELLEHFPCETLESYRALPLCVNNGVLELAMYNPFDVDVIEDIRQNYGFTSRINLLPKARVLKAVEYYCSDIRARRAAQVKGFAEGDNQYVVSFVDALINHGFSAGASDIHIEPFETQTQLRLRIDGVMRSYCTLPAEAHGMIVSRIKVMSNLDIAEHIRPQDGSMIFLHGDEGLHLRVSVMPTVYGEKTVLRFLDFAGEVDNPAFCGMTEKNYEKLLKMLRAPSGLIYFTGPTGSGKTTTLYMILERLAEKPVNISTIEDPVERRITHVIQTEVNPRAEIYFSTGLRAILRQDPDIIMVGETRDPDTAAVSVRAASTGHLVLSTLHTKDSVSAISRLFSMDVEPFMMADSLIGVVAQRLLRKICDCCAEDYIATDSDKEYVGKNTAFLKRGRGCYYCNYTGYKGRVAIHEVFAVDDNVRRMLTERAEIPTIRSYAVNEQGMTLLSESAKQLVRDGITTVEEALSATKYS